MMKNTAKIGVLTIGILVRLGQIPALADDWLDGTKEAYGFTNWVGQTQTNYTCLVTNWVPNLEACGVTNVAPATTVVTDEGIRDTTYFFSPTNTTNVVIELKVIHALGVTNAHCAMMEKFSLYQAPGVFPLGTTNTIIVGDRCYASATNPCPGVDFVRNNVYVSIDSYEGTCDVRNVAVALDNQLKAISTGQ